MHAIKYNKNAEGMEQLFVGILELQVCIVVASLKPYHLCLSSPIFFSIVTLKKSETLHFLFFSGCRTNILTSCTNS